MEQQLSLVTNFHQEEMLFARGTDMNLEKEKAAVSISLKSPPMMSS